MSDAPQPPDQPASAAPPTSRWRGRLLVAALVVAVAALTWWLLGDRLNLAYLAENEAALRAWYAEHPALALASAFVLYVAVTALSLPGAAPLTLACGWFFGFATALVLVSCASTTGATLAMLLSRYLFRGAVERRFGERLARVQQSLEREGAWYLFTLRLIPAVPFFVINALMGLTPIRAWTFWWVSQLGMLPGTAVYVYAGASVPSAADLAERGVGGILTPSLFAALAALAAFPWIVRWIVAAVRKRA